MEDSDAFTLPCNGKQSWFDNHREFLPKDHPFRRNTTAFIKGKRVSKEFRGVRTGESIVDELTNKGFKKLTEMNAEQINGQLSKTCGWSKRSIFWDLSYWSTLLIRHNLDVMHIEKNMFDNIFNTILNVPEKIKDNAKSREELNVICRRPQLAKDGRIGQYPKASYILDRDSKALLFESKFKVEVS